MEAGGRVDVALELADGGGVDGALELADDVQGKQGEEVGVVSFRLEELVDGVIVEEEADELSIDEVTGDVDGSSSGVECWRLDLGEAFVDVGS